MNGFYYVYILVSETNYKLHYSGVTRDLTTRLAEHNRGNVPRIQRKRSRQLEKLASLIINFAHDSGSESEEGIWSQSCR
jgi:predicted GIY-YIG superfamily endonuclease